MTRSLFARRNGLVDGVYSVLVDVAIPPGTEDVVVHDLETIGGRLSWYGAVPGWIARLVLGRLVGNAFDDTDLRPWCRAPLSTGGASPGS